MATIRENFSALMVLPLDLRLGPIARSLLVGDAKTREELAHALLKGQNERLDISAMDAKERSNADVTGLLEAWRGGDLDARDRVATLVYQELRRRAGAYLRRERVGHTLQPTALVHEVFLLLVKQDRTAWQNRAQFFGVASRMMRRLLVDRARARNMAKRSGRWARVTLDEEMAQGQAEVDVLDLDRALSALAAFDPRKSQVAELRFFGGLSLEETGHVVGLSVATVEREWQAARAWLYARLTGASA
jgi:RNA polymerase sigma factor (TIGR02999 family)